MVDFQGLPTYDDMKSVHTEHSGGGQRFLIHERYYLDYFINQLMLGY